MKKAILFFVFVLTSLSIVFTDSREITIVSYNTENFFDIIDNKDTTGDDEFTPEGAKKWTKERYNKKKLNIAKVLTCINNKELPDIIGLAEIENKSVLIDLLNEHNFKNEKYHIIHRDSPDFRGIDTAILIKDKELEVLDYVISLVVSFFFGSFTKLKVLNDNEIIYVFMNHWPSRMNPERYRIMAAEILIKKINSILNSDKNAKIIVLGDFNDEPTDKSLFNILNAKFDFNNHELYNLMSSYTGKTGTYYYSKEKKWDIFDNIIISKGLFESKKGFVLINKKANIFKDKFILRKKKSGIWIPNKTYEGNKYHGGYSDHLPVYLILEKKM